MRMLTTGIWCFAMPSTDLACVATLGCRLLSSGVEECQLAQVLVSTVPMRLLIRLRAGYALFVCDAFNPSFVLFAMPLGYLALSTNSTLPIKLEPAPIQRSLSNSTLSYSTLPTDANLSYSGGLSLGWERGQLTDVQP
eukprot:2548482-Rhodomonas_salina.1